AGFEGGCMDRVLKLLAFAGLALAHAAIASPRETFPFTAVNSNGPLGNQANGQRNMSPVGGYLATKIAHSGALRSLHPDTFASEARIQVTPPNGRPSFVLQPFAQNAT